MTEASHCSFKKLLRFGRGSLFWIQYLRIDKAPDLRHRSGHRHERGRDLQIRRRNHQMVASLFLVGSVVAGAAVMADLAAVVRIVVAKAEDGSAENRGEGKGAGGDQRHPSPDSTSSFHH